MGNRNYYIEIAGKQEPAILSHRTCPDCASELGAIHPDRVWCVNESCNYGELHVVGEGTRELPLKENFDQGIPL